MIGRAAFAATAFAAALSPMASHAETVRVTLPEAVERALSEGTADKLAALRVDEARTGAALASAALRPRVDVSVSDVNQSLNLKTFGLTFPGFPSVVPPFNVFDAHVAASMNVIDIAARRRSAAARQRIRVGEAERERSDSDVAAAVASLFLTIRRADSLVDETEANVKLFERLRAEAAHQQEAGVGTRLDTTRADVQLSRQRQALVAARNQRDAARLALLHAIGADMGDDLVLVGAPSSPPPAIPDPEEAIADARRLRPELRSADEELTAAEMLVSAAKGERLPKLSAQFQGGYNGNYLGDLSWTRIVGGSLAFSVYDGGERAARLAEARRREEELRIERRELDRQIEEEVRRDILAYRSAASRSELAEESARLAGDELTFATDRFVNGVSSDVEVDNAQTSVAAARDARIAALADQEQAWIDLARATGRIREVIEKENP